MRIKSSVGTEAHKTPRFYISSWQSICRILILIVIVVMVAAGSSQLSATTVYYDFTVPINRTAGNGYFAFDDSYVTSRDILNYPTAVDLGLSRRVYTFDSASADICVIQPSNGTLHLWPIGGLANGYCTDVRSNQLPVTSEDFPSALVSEPKTFVLFALGLGWMSVVALRKKRRQNWVR